MSARWFAILMSLSAIGCLGGCASSPQGGGPAADAPRPPLTLAGLPATFVGVLPCADCEGIRTHLNLHADGSYILRSTYLSRPDPATFDDLGRWALGSDETTVVLQGGREAPQYYSLQAGSLRLLDREGRPIESDLPYDLARADTFVSLEPRLLLRGSVRYLADAATFEECLTGHRYPVAFEAERPALERAYAEAAPEPGAPVLASIEGRIAPRPRMEGDGDEAQVIVERVVGMWPGEECDPVFATAPLSRTRWHLTRLGDEPVIPADEARRPYIELDETTGRLAGLGGCNRLIGGFTLAGHAITVSSVAATMMACPDGMDREREFTLALEAAREWRVVGPILELRAVDGRLLARFEARR